MTTLTSGPPQRTPLNIDKLTVRHDRPLTPWPWWHALFTAPFAPLLTIRRVEPIAWWQALTVHVVWWGVSIVTPLLWDPNSMAFGDNPMMSAAALILMAIMGGFFMQFLWLLVPILCVPLMARPQPLRRNVLLAIKRFWLVTPCLVVISLASQLVVRSTLVSSLIMGHDDPFYDPDFFVQQLLNVGGTALWVFILLLALRQRPWWPHCRWPAVCAGCGYTLLGVTADQSCPECGKPVFESTDMEALCDPQVGRSWRQVPMAWSNPADYIRRRGVLTPQRLVPWLVLIAAAVTFLGILTLAVIEGGAIPTAWEWLSLLASTLLVFLLVSSFLCLSTLVLALFSRQRDRHHALVGMGRTLPSLMLTGAMFALLVVAAIRTATHFDADRLIFGLEGYIWITICVTAVLVAGAGLHFSALRRIGRAARWANW